MSTTPIDNFLLSLAVAIAGNASLAGPAAPAAAGRALWVNDAVEDKAAAVYSVLRQYGGASLDTFAGSRILSASLQVDTRGTTQRAVRGQAWAIYESLLEADGRPRMHWAIAGKVMGDGGAVVDDAGGAWEVREVDFTGGVPGVTGRDEQGRYMAPFSFDVEFDRIEN